MGIIGVAKELSLPPSGKTMDIPFTHLC
jgi:hypothetical protein